MQMLGCHGPCAYVSIAIHYMVLSAQISCCCLQTGSVLIPFFQQFTGINTIMFYATQLFSVLGDGANAALLNTAIVGAVNVGSTILAIILVDRYAVHLNS